MLKTFRGPFQYVIIPLTENQKTKGQSIIDPHPPLPLVTAICRSETKGLSIVYVISETMCYPKKWGEEGHITPHPLPQVTNIFLLC